MLLDAVHRVGQVVAPRVDLQRDAALADQGDRRRVLDDVDAVADAVRRRQPDGLYHERGWRILAGVDGELEPGLARLVDGGQEVLQREIALAVGQVNAVDLARVARGPRDRAGA